MKAMIHDWLEKMDANQEKLETKMKEYPERMQVK
jgi:hypothetical protein